MLMVSLSAHGPRKDAGRETSCYATETN
eukprot:SAG31_NODE_40633_length_279_cov_31.888889_1_plen_27_part_01